MIRKICKKDKINFLDYCSQYGTKIFEDFSFKNLEREFNILIKRSGFCLVDEESGVFRGILFIKKIDNNYYINSIYKNPKILDRLLNILVWNFEKDLILKINDYKCVSTIKKYYFRLTQRTEKEFTYFRKYFKRVKK